MSVHNTIVNILRRHDVLPPGLDPDSTSHAELLDACLMRLTAEIRGLRLHFNKESTAGALLKRMAEYTAPPEVQAAMQAAVDAFPSDEDTEETEDETMYEKFTDKARRVMQLANQEALRFNHEYIGTEHILLGLIRQGKGRAMRVFNSFTIDPRKVRLEVEKLMQSGPDMVIIGTLLRTPRAKKVIEYAIEEAASLDHLYVGTEHILLGLLREYDGVAALMLSRLGLTPGKVREEVRRLQGEAEPED